MNDKLYALPEIMRWGRNWCIAGPDDKGQMKAPYTVGSNGVPYRAKVNDPSKWMDFETAKEHAERLNTYIGYMLQKGQDLVCIDLDVVDEETQISKGEPVDPEKWSTQADLNRFWAIVQAFDSFTEKSKSGKGLHIWMRGNIGTGTRRDGVEVYNQERFIICTGDVICNKALAQNDELLKRLVEEIRAEQNRSDELIELPQLEEDAVIWKRAREASNGSKFTELCSGRWQQYGYPSQSEADFSLMSMFAFYSQSNEQCRRMFRQTVLGSREKTNKSNYHLDRALKGIRGRQALEKAQHDHGNEIADSLIKNLRHDESVDPLQELVRQMQNRQIEEDLNVPKPAPANLELLKMSSLPKVDEGELEWPPGFVGKIAHYVYRSAVRPVREVAIVSALGLMAGICGKSFSIPQSGLNLYIILVARSAIGKEAMHGGIAGLIASLSTRCAGASNFVDFNDFASGPALVKAVSENQSFLNVAGEWGKKLKRLSSESMHDGPMQQLRTVMTNLYQKSGPGSIVGGINYSKKENNIASISGVAYSMIGETTPNTLYDSLTESMMEDGFLSRFTIVEYKGKRPPEQEDRIYEPDPMLADALAEICTHSLILLSRNSRQEVGRDEESLNLLKEFNLECDRQINSTDDESYRQMWNRAHLKVLRIAALLAVGDNYVHPVIQKVHVDWAIDIIRKDINVMTKRIAGGDVGTDDKSRERKLLNLCHEYITKGAGVSYGIPEEMIKAGIMPRKFLQIRVANITSFSKHRLGSTPALDLTLRSMVDSGYLLECDKGELITKYKFHGKCYRILDVNSY